MKRRIRNISNILLISAAVLALVIGCSLGSIADFSRAVIDAAFPVTYNIDFINGHQSMLTDAKVVFGKENAFVSSEEFNGVIALNDAVFSCTNETQRSQNTIRYGMLTALLSALAITAAAFIAWLGIEVRSLAVKKVRRSTAASVRRPTPAGHHAQVAAPYAA